MEFILKESLRNAPDEELLEDLKRCSAELGRTTITLAQYEEIGKAHPSTIQRRFGSWTTALAKAGLEPSRSKIGITNQELFENIEDIWIRLGRQPSYGEVKKPSSKFSAGTYEKRFGTWTKALENFVIFSNTDDTENDQTDEINPQDDRQKPTKKRTKREISGRLRFKILMRAGFSCMACGASPLKNPGVDLHVDHIVPWSEGGETVEDNLQAKCAKCNLGKGNAFHV